MARVSHNKANTTKEIRDEAKVTRPPQSAVAWQAHFNDLYAI